MSALLSLSKDPLWLLHWLLPFRLILACLNRCINRIFFRLICLLVNWRRLIWYHCLLWDKFCIKLRVLLLRYITWLVAARDRWFTYWFFRLLMIKHLLLSIVLLCWWTGALFDLRNRILNESAVDLNFTWFLWGKWNRRWCHFCIISINYDRRICLSVSFGFH